MKYNFLLFLFCVFLCCSAEFLCLSRTDCNHHGECNENRSDCICEAGYVTFKSDDKCNYEQKNRIIAFILHLLMFFIGAGEWYLGNIYLACIPIVLLFIWLLFEIGLFCVTYCVDIKEDTIRNVQYFMKCVILTLFTLWTFVEIVYIGNGIRKDSNGIPTTI